MPNVTLNLKVGLWPLDFKFMLFFSTIYGLGQANSLSGEDKSGNCCFYIIEFSEA